MSLTLDRKAFVDILYEGKGWIGGAMLPPPDGLWGMPPELSQTLPGYGPDIAKNRAEAQKLSRSPAMAPTTGSRSRCRRATPPTTGIRRSS